MRIRYECHKVTIRETELTLIGAVVGMQSGVYSFLVKRSGFTCSRSVGVARLLQVILSSSFVCPFVVALALYLCTVALPSASAVFVQLRSHPAPAIVPAPAAARPGSRPCPRARSSPAHSPAVSRDTHAISWATHKLCFKCGIKGCNRI